MEDAPLPAVQGKSFLKGTQPLWKAFWVLYFVGGLCFSLMILVAVSLAASSGMISQAAGIMNLPAERLLIFVVAVLVGLYLIYFIFCFVSVFKCSKRYGNRFWTIAGRLVVIVNLGWILYSTPPAILALIKYFEV